VLGPLKEVRAHPPVESQRPKAPDQVSEPKGIEYLAQRISADALQRYTVVGKRRAKGLSNLHASSYWNLAPRGLRFWSDWGHRGPGRGGRSVPIWGPRKQNEAEWNSRWCHQHQTHLLPATGGISGRN
jgi:hypothetical protein